MDDFMQLNTEQKNVVVQWVKEGCGLSEIQRRLAAECKLNLTYMDVRFLVLDLGLDLQEKKTSPAVAQDLSSPPQTPSPAMEGSDSGLPDETADSTPGAGGVSIDVDRIMRPGSLVSGTVVFSDGIKATWALDQMGRLALGGTDKSYRPSAQDVQEFQMAIARELQKRGYA
jgi:hypothetical protein